MYFYKQGNVKEVIYMTAIKLSDQGLSETLLGLVDAVLQEFRKKVPYITNIYIVNHTMLVHTTETLQLKFSIKSVNPKVQSLCVKITMSPVAEKIGVTEKVLLQNILFKV